MEENTILGLDEDINLTIDDIGEENVNLMFLGVDQSISMEPFISDMENSLLNFKDGLLNSKDSEEILISRANFSDSIFISGYRKIDEIDTSYKAAGMTCLDDVIVEGGNKLIDYMSTLKNQGLRVKAIFCIFSDGENTININHSEADAIDMIKQLNDLEVVTAFIAFGSGAKSSATKLGFRNIKDISNSSNPGQELRHTFHLLSKSVVESSKSVLGKQDDFFN